MFMFYKVDIIRLVYTYKKRELSFASFDTLRSSTT